MGIVRVRGEYIESKSCNLMRRMASGRIYSMRKGLYHFLSGGDYERS